MMYKIAFYFIAYFIDTYGVSACQFSNHEVAFACERKNPQSRLYSTELVGLAPNIADEIANYIRPPWYSAPRAPHKHTFVIDGLQFNLVPGEDSLPTLNNPSREEIPSWSSLRLTDMRFKKSHPNILFHCYYSGGPNTPDKPDISVVFQAALPSNINISTARLRSIAGSDAQMFFEKGGEIITDARAADAIIIVPAYVTTVIEFSYINTAAAATTYIPLLIQEP